jgi:hypothetical protein
MLCADCGHTAVAETRWPGSDVVESIGWLLGGLPGWLFCAWRHALRTKHCAVCGSETLARETRACAARRPLAAPHFRRRGRDARLWPSHLRDPRARLQHGVGCVGVWLLLAVGPPPFAVCAAAMWGMTEASLGAKRRAADTDFEAWDARGRRLPIELA